MVSCARLPEILPGLRGPSHLSGTGGSITVPILTNEMRSVFAILGLVIILLVFDILRVDVIGLLVMTLLPVAGLLTPSEALAGLG